MFTTKEFQLFNRTFRFTNIFDKISRYDFGSTDRYDDYMVDRTYSFHRILPGLYVLNNNWFIATWENTKHATMKPRIIKDLRFMLKNHIL